MSVRDMQGDPGIWETLSWRDLSGQEQELWTLLGWQQDQWDRNDAPASSNKVWNDLNQQERSAALNLGFSEEIWNNVEDE